MELQDIARVIMDFITKEVEKRESQGVVVGLSGVLILL